MDIKFKVQVRLSLLVATFCMVSLLGGKTEAAYWSTLSGILGYWLPTPSETLINRREKKNEPTT
jgi:hypothetical protein